MIMNNKMKNDSFEEFCARTKRYFSERYTDTADVSVRPIQKTNRIRVALLIKPYNSTMIPTIYLEDFYAAYLSGQPYMSVFDDIAELYNEAAANKNEKPIKSFADDLSDLKAIKSKIVFSPINKKVNSEMLKDVPYANLVGDIALIFVIPVDVTNFSKGVCVVKNSFLKEWNKDNLSYNLFINKLYRYAYNNTRRILSPKIRSFAEVLVEELKQGAKESGDYIPNNVYEMLYEQNNEIPLLTLINDQNMFSPSYMAYTSILEEICNKMNSDSCFILPVTRFRIVFVPTKHPDGRTITLNDCKKVIARVNFLEVNDKNYLSNNIYHYDNVTKNLIVV